MKLRCILPSFFDIMINLTMYLIYENKICDPGLMRFMYPVERYLKITKEYMINRSRRKDRITYSYIIKEVLQSWSKYIPNMESIGLPSDRYSDRTNGESVIRS